MDHPAQYVGDAAFYHEMRAFGYWSLPEKNCETERWLEEQLDRAVAFYEGRWSRETGADCLITGTLCIPTTGNAMCAL